jgi:hypothetical protein
VQVLGVAYNPDASPAVVMDFIRRFGVNFPVGYRDVVRVNDYLQLSPVMRNFVPNLVVIDRNWTIRGQWAGDDPLFQDENKKVRAFLDGLLKKRAPAGKKAAPKSKKK